MHVRRISVTKYPYPYPFKHGNYYPYLISIRENYGRDIRNGYLSAPLYRQVYHDLIILCFRQCY